MVRLKGLGKLKNPVTSSGIAKYIPSPGKGVQFTTATKIDTFL
jgi:hypothetical protein